MHGRLPTPVDIGMPTRGDSPWVTEALDSIVAQTFGAWRLVVSENGPGSPEFAATLEPYLADARITHHVTGRDIGAAGNHTHLTSQGDAQYVALLHDDDRWEPEFLARRVEFLDAHPACGLVFGRWATIDGSGERIDESACPLAEGEHAPETMIPIFLRAYPVGMTSLLVRRSAYELAGPWADMPWMDVEMWFRIAARLPTGYLDVLDSEWRRHDSQWSAQVGRWGETLSRVYGRFEETLDAVPSLRVDRTPLRELQAQAAVQWSLDAADAGDVAAARQHLARAKEIHPPIRRDRRVVAAELALRLPGRGASLLRRIRRLSWKLSPASLTGFFGNLFR
jgi:glycosyltransferase involved in cell wall biosynthesis